MYLNKNFLDFMFSGKLHYEGTMEDLFIVNEPIGFLVVTKGRIVMADPYAINYGTVVSEKIDNGKYPVNILTAHVEPHDEVKVAGFLVRFDEEAVPDEWKMCLPNFVDDKQIPDDGYYGVSTESGNLTICAEQTVGWLVEHPDESAEVLEDIEKQISQTYFANGGVANSILPGLEVNLITMVGGAPAEGYPAYWGYKDGKCVCMAVDFLVAD